MNNNLKISLIQSDIEWENIEANLFHFSNFLNKVERDTDIVILPEMFSTGFTMQAMKYAEDASGKTFAWLKKSTTDYNFSITGSMIFSSDNRIFNRLIWMNPSGNSYYYDKRHLFRM